MFRQCRKALIASGFPRFKSVSLKDSIPGTKEDHPTAPTGFDTGPSPTSLQILTKSAVVLLAAPVWVQYQTLLAGKISVLLLFFCFLRFMAYIVEATEKALYYFWSSNKYLCSILVKFVHDKTNAIEFLFYLMRIFHAAATQSCQSEKFLTAENN